MSQASIAKTIENTCLKYKVASEDWEFAQIHQLNYDTFVEEIPQHSPNPDRVLVDAFHDQNTYLIAVRGRTLLGMLAIRGERPFSLDRKLPNLDRYFPSGRRMCEVRLLATTTGSRNGVVFRGLIDAAIRHGLRQGYNLALISGTIRQKRLYEHLGFVPFGPIVGHGEALYQPMSLTLASFRRHENVFPALLTVPHDRTRESLNFLPGPISIQPNVRAAFQAPPLSHRSPAFVRDFQETRRELCRLTGSRHVALMMGTGSLANDAVAAELSLERGDGLILSNGAFGDRLIDHATRFGLPFETIRLPWGQSFCRAMIESRLDQNADIHWLWAVHGETSTGVLNDLDMLKSITRARKCDLCLDAVSSLGTTPVDLNGVRLASGVSGKGLGSYCGIAIVFHDTSRTVSSPQLPRYLDLGYAAQQDGIPFTFSSNLLSALKAALHEFEGERHFRQIDECGTQLRCGLRQLGFQLVAEDSPFPAVTTVALPQGCSSGQFGGSLEQAGFLLHYRSAYLRNRNWVQICLMGVVTSEIIDELLECFDIHWMTCNNESRQRAPN